MSKEWTYKPGDWYVKICSVCKEEKTITSFYKNKNGVFGVRSICKECSKNRYKPSKNRKVYTATYRQKNYAKCLEASRQWRKNNLAYDAYRAKLYRTRKDNQCPTWANLDKIKEFYLKCPSGYHVDHIIPLKGKVVSGLHVETNLQYLTAKENQQKRNFYYV